MIRPAAMSDLPRLHALLREQHENSKFHPDVGIDEPTMRSILLHGVQRHGGTNNGSSCLFVEEHKNAVEGFVFGILNRVYHIGDRLAANDMFLVCTEKARTNAVNQLIDAYTEWAFENPKVSRIMLSWTDAIGTDGNKIEALYKRKGFSPVGGLWERAGQ